MASRSKGPASYESEVTSDILKNLISELETLENQSIHDPIDDDDPETKIDKLTGTSVMLKLKEFVDSDDRGFEDKLELLQGCKNLLVHKIENEKKSLGVQTRPAEAHGNGHVSVGAGTSKGKPYSYIYLQQPEFKIFCKYSCIFILL